jgi:hypothetical protein
VWSFTELIEPLLEDVKKALGENPVILNQEHPFFLQIARAANNPGKETRQSENKPSVRAALSH